MAYTTAGTDSRPCEGHRLAGQPNPAPELCEGHKLPGQQNLAPPPNLPSSVLSGCPWLLQLHCPCSSQ